jgi:hypothetical protein
VVVDVISRFCILLHNLPSIFMFVIGFFFPI